MSMPVEPAPQERSGEVEEVLTALSGSSTLELLGMTAADLNAARTDPTLFETLRITHEVLRGLRDGGVLPTFVRLPRDEQSNFLRWIAATDDRKLRERHIATFVLALLESPFARS